TQEKCKDYIPVGEQVDCKNGACMAVSIGKLRNYCKESKPHSIFFLGSGMLKSLGDKKTHDCAGQPANQPHNKIRRRICFQKHHANMINQHRRDSYIFQNISIHKLQSALPDIAFLIC
ncbi:MAG: hypothetical protein FWG40_08730, partial [Peptococcaceae bacterium]|nr:hypothetical protein [Peptococcaceae bacterium]